MYVLSETNQRLGTCQDVYSVYLDS